MKKLLHFSTWAALLFGASPAFGAVISWTTSPAVDTSEVNNIGFQQFGYAFNTALSGTATLNGATFTYVNTELPGLGMAAANTLTPGFERFGGDSRAEGNDEFHLGPNQEFNQILDGLTWGGNTQFQLNNLTPGTPYIVQIFSSDDRAGFINRVLDLDSSWATPDGIRQLENIDYTAGGAWTDPAGRQRVFTGTFTADAPTQEILAVLDNGGGQIDLNAIQLRIVPEPAAGSLLLGMAGLLGLVRRRRH